MYVPRKVEEKIRYLCRKFPNLEWSGVLFTRHSGNFEDGTLEIYCEDIYPMDLGSPGFTQFKMDETVAAYIAENIELFDCDVQLIHSHNNMSCFFSGQDQATLREEGNDRNCFVSLIVNNAGTYCAAVTRKLQLTKKITVQTSGVSYEFFGEGKKALTAGVPPIEETSEEAVIQYFMLDVEREIVENPLEYLDYRFNEIERKKEESKAVPAKNFKIDSPAESDDEFFDWLHSNRKNTVVDSPALFDKDTMEELVDTSKWQPDPTIIHYLAAQLLTTSLIVNPDIDLKQWVTRHMKKKYDEIFSRNDEEFMGWSDSFVEFIVNHYNDTEVPAEVYDDWDTYQGKVAEALMDEISSYPSNKYIDGYIDVLNRYLV
jgi:hypothetical protein